MTVTSEDVNPGASFGDELDARPKVTTVIPPEEWREEDRVARKEAMLAKLMDRAALRDIPPPEPLIHGYLNLDSAARLTGASGTGKTFGAISMAAAVATGRDWFGHQVRQGPVVYLAAEGVRGLNPRIEAWERRNDTNLDGEPFYLYPEAVQTNHATDWDVWVEICAEIKPVLIILDTQARVTVGVEENSNSDMARVVNAVDALKRATGACVLLIHHTGHEHERARGASAVKGAMDTELLMVLKGELDVRLPADGPWDEQVWTVNQIELRTDKQKDSEPTAPRSFYLHRVALDDMFDAMGAPMNSAVLTEVPDGSKAPSVEDPASKGGQRIADVVALLDKLDVSLKHGRPAVIAILKDAGVPVPKTEVLGAAITERKEAAKRAVEEGETT